MNVLAPENYITWKVTRFVQSVMGFTMGLYIFTYGPLFYESLALTSNPNTAITLTTFLMGFVMALTALLETPTGAIADAIGRKQTIVWSFGFRAGFFLFLTIVPFVTSMSAVMAFGLLAMCSFSISYAFYNGAFTAWCIDSFREEAKGVGYEHVLSRGYTYNFLAKTLGGIIGVSCYLSKLPQIGFIVASLISGLCCHYCIKHMKEPQNVHFLDVKDVSLSIVTQRIGKILGISFQVISRSPAILALVAIFATFMTVLNIIDYLWPVYLRSTVTSAQQAIPWIGLVMGTQLISAAGARTLTIVGKISSKKGLISTSNSVLEFIFLFVALVSAVSVLTLSYRTIVGGNHILLLCLAVLTIRFSFGIVAPCFETLINNYIPEEFSQERSTIISFGSLVRSLLVMLIAIPSGGSSGETTTHGWALPAFLLMATTLAGVIIFWRTRSPVTINQIQDDDFTELAKAIGQAKEAKRRLIIEEARLHAEAAIGQLASQVAHDVRSPLTALKIAISHLNELPEEKRILIRKAVQRIDDIAFDLAAKKTQSVPPGDKANTTLTVELLSDLIESLIAEKRTQYRSQADLHIQSPFDSMSYGLFARMEPAIFKRVLSNLVNNAVEAMHGVGTLTISMTHDSENIHIDICDNGPGIDESVLPLLMQKGASYGKPEGSGLGLFHAQQSLEHWEGKLQLKSIKGQGTTVTMLLPRAAPPAWFTAELRILPGSTIIIADDDASIHQIWKNRFQDITDASNIMLQHYLSAKETLLIPAIPPPLLFLCDYEFLGEQMNGVELIQELGINQHAILVTSHFDEPAVQQACNALGIRMIPKSLAGFVPIRLAESAELIANTKHPPTALVLDDDEGIRLAWRLERERLGIGHLATFASMEECEATQPDYAQYDFAFVDKNIPASAWRLDHTIAHLKARGVKRVLVASGESQRALLNDPLCAGADEVVAWKIPEQLPRLG